VSPRERQRLSPTATLVIVGLVIAVAAMIVVLMFALSGNLPSPRDCAANPNLLGC
jgi:hypothetical protein